MKTALDVRVADHPGARAELHSMRLDVFRHFEARGRLADAVERLTAELDALRKDAERGRWLVGWLMENGLLHALRCRPAADAPTGDYWVLQRPAILDGDNCEGYGMTKDAAIDAAMESKP